MDRVVAYKTANQSLSSVLQLDPGQSVHSKEGSGLHQKDHQMTIGRYHACVKELRHGGGGEGGNVNLVEGGLIVITQPLLGQLVHM